MIAILTRGFLIAALLAGWQAALVHPLEHHGKRGELVHLGQDQQRSPGSLCDALDDLTACAPAAPAVVAAAPAVHAVFLPHHAAPRAADAPPFLSQGPPSLL